MEWLKSKTAIVGILCLAVVGVQGYAMMSMRNTMEERLSAIESDSSAADEKITMLTTDLDVVNEKVGVTSKELEEAQAAAKQLQKENTQLSRKLAGKADSKSVMKFQTETTDKMNSVQQEASTRMDGITGDVKVVRTDLDVTRTDLKATRADLTTTRSDLNATREEVANSRKELGGLIARNSTELAELRRKGERDYVEFDIRSGKEFKRIGDVMVQLKKTDVKKQKYEVVINADDTPIQKKDRTANEPVTFLVGRDRARYELVVNTVEKDRIRGYISAPKDSTLTAEGPSLRVTK
jgi:chromosome segregation ATPase